MSYNQNRIGVGGLDKALSVITQGDPGKRGGTFSEKACPQGKGMAARSQRLKRNALRTLLRLSPGEAKEKAEPTWEAQAIRKSSYGGGHAAD